MLFNYCLLSKFPILRAVRWRDTIVESWERRPFDACSLARGLVAGKERKLCEAFRSESATRGGLLFCCSFSLSLTWRLKLVSKSDWNSGFAFLVLYEPASFLGAKSLARGVYGGLRLTVKKELELLATGLKLCYSCFFPEAIDSALDGWPANKD